MPRVGGGLMPHPTWQCWFVARRIACPAHNYPQSEARYASLKAWLLANPAEQMYRHPLPHAPVVPGTRWFVGEANDNNESMTWVIPIVDGNNATLAEVFESEADVTTPAVELMAAAPELRDALVQIATHTSPHSAGYLVVDANDIAKARALLARLGVVIR
jgi:hypothetical protein